MSGAKRILHVFSTFGTGGPQVRAVQLMAAMGRDVAHAVLAMDGDTTASKLVEAGVNCRVLPPLPRGNVFTNVGRLARLIGSEPFDLLLTYNWGAIEAVWAARVRGMRAVVHHEDGFRPDEVTQRKWRRNFLRRVLLPGVQQVIVPSSVLLGIAEREWRLRPGHVVHLPNGVDLQRFRRRSRAPNRQCVIGTVGGLRPEKDHALLLRAFAAMQQPAKLLIIGDGALRGELEQLAQSLSLQARVEFTGAMADPAVAYARMDVFALSSRTEQMPLSVLEAMACALPVVATDVGDVRAMLPAASHGALVPASDVAAMTAALDAQAAAPDLRSQQGRANRAHAEAHYELQACLRRFQDVCDAAADGCRRAPRD